MPDLYVSVEPYKGLIYCYLSPELGASKGLSTSERTRGSFMAEASRQGAVKPPASYATHANKCIGSRRELCDL